MSDQTIVVQTYYLRLLLWYINLGVTKIFGLKSGQHVEKIAFRTIQSFCLYRVIIKKLHAANLEIDPFYGNRSFITEFTTAHHLSQHWATSVGCNIIVPFTTRSSMWSLSLMFFYRTLYNFFLTIWTTLHIGPPCGHYSRHSACGVKIVRNALCDVDFTRTLESMGQ